MLETVDLAKSLPKPEYESRIGPLAGRLFALQKACWDARIPTVVLFEGWDAAGKGTTVNTLTERLDPRGFQLHATTAPRTVESHMPWLWRFWLRIPAYGEMGLFDRSWYGRVLVERIERITPKKIWRGAYTDIVEFERALSADGYSVVKFFLHISKKEQKRRFKRMAKDPELAWHLQPEDWLHHKHYDDYVEAIEEMLARTETEWGPWTLVEATDLRWARVKVFETLIRRMEESLTARGLATPPQGELKMRPIRPRKAGHA
jgi:polyphosphate kinase 2 (PPK2 family)